jgi:non-heme chloroperoxidase
VTNSFKLFPVGTGEDFRDLLQAITASPPDATRACVDAWIEDFRQDIARNTVPTLILHGDADRILPADATSRRQAKMIKNVQFVELKGGPHGVLWTHAEQVNAELVKFLG